MIHQYGLPLLPNRGTTAGTLNLQPVGNQSMVGVYRLACWIGGRYCVGYNVLSHGEHTTYVCKYDGQVYPL